MLDRITPPPLPPGATIGILGGGQLGRMLAIAAARLGIKTHVLSDAPGPAFDVATRATHGSYDDKAVLASFAEGVECITYEFENVPLDTAEFLAEIRPVRPGPQALAVAQDRLTEKTFITGLGIAVAPFAEVNSAADAAAALKAFDAPAILKTRRLGYDGKGQVSLRPGDSSARAWEEIGGKPAVLEQRIAFTREVSALVVRGLDGETMFYDCPANTHVNGILDRSVVPCGLPDRDQEDAREIAGRIAAALDYVGVLAVEMFHLGPSAPAGKRLIVNEIAPRVHNSGHWTIDACAVSQFENHIRAVAGWPLGTTRRHSDAEMRNLIGPQALDWLKLAQDPDACLHLYGKRDARAGRKMGHVTRISPRSASLD
jgi:5-(carboxyamino)imidazole ribonucleotide synthase